MNAFDDITDEQATKPGPGVLTVLLNQQHTALAIEHARLACIGGSSAVRQDDRSARLLEDQIIGQFGQLALSLYWFGQTQPYEAARAYANAHPTEGDGGSDFLNGNLDVKTSLMRASSDPFSYRMLVRPRERHEGNVYILALIPKLLKVNTQVHLVGWLADQELPKNPATMGQFAGAYMVTADQLHPLPPVRWKMPDANKFSKLRETGYKVPVTCGLCNYGCFMRGQDWGTCQKHQYEHLKHTGPARDVSIHRFGTCPKAEARLVSAALLGAHAEFLEGKAGK